MPPAVSVLEVSMEEHLRVEVHPVDGFTAVDAAGEIDLATAPELRGALERTTGRVVVHLDEVTYLDSSGIAVLVAQQHRLASDDGELVLRRPSPLVRKTLELTGLGPWIDG
jgi:anti-anti-sigma factor